MSSATVAVFDLDGTITRHDTLIDYMAGYLRMRPWRVFGCMLVLPTILLYLVGLADRSTLKAAVIRAALGGSTREQIERWTERWAAVLLERGIFADAAARIARHRAAGDILVLMSGSPDVYVPTLARSLGFTEVICTCIRWDSDRLHGSLTTPNCRDEEKVRRFEILRARHPGARFVAYANATSDLPHLRLADVGVLVNGDDLARREAERMQVACERWN